MVYNFACSIVSLYSVVFILVALARNWPRSLFLREEDPLVSHALWVYYMTKYIELMDTVFMIVRHRPRQVSLLHVSSLKHVAFIEAPSRSDSKLLIRINTTDGGTFFRVGD